MTRNHRTLKIIYRILKNGILIIFIIAIVEYLVIPKITGAKKSVNLITKANISLVVLAVGVEVTSLLAYSMLFRSLLHNKKLKFPTLFNINLSTLSLSHILPGGTAPSSALSYRLLTSQGVSNSDATFSIATSGIGSAAVLNIILWFSLLISIPFRSVKNPLYAVAAIIGSLLIGLIAIGILLLTHGEEFVVVYAKKISNKIPLANPDKIEGFLRNIAQRIDDLIKDRDLMLRALVWASSNWLLDAGCLWLFLAAFGKVMSPIDLLVAYGLANVLAAIPITPGGLGVVEGVLIPTIHGFGASSNVALVAVLSYRLINFWLPIPAGGVSYLNLKIKSRKRGIDISKKTSNQP